MFNLSVKLIDSNDASQIKDASGLNQQQINDKLSDKSSLYADVLDSSDVKGDGVTSDSSGLQEYADRLQLARNTTTFIPMRDKNYLITEPLVYQEPCMIYGDKAATYDRGQGTDGWLLTDGSSDHVINLGNYRENSTTTDIEASLSQNPADQFTIKNIGIKYTGTPPLLTSGIRHTAATDGPDRGLVIREFSGLGLDNAIHISDQGKSTQLANLVVENSVIHGCRYAIKADGNVLGARIVGNQLEQNSEGAIHGTFNGSVTIEDNMLEGQPNTINITIPPITGNRPKVSISRNYFESNTGDYLAQIDATTAGQLIVENNFHFNLNDNAALTDLLKLSGSYDYIKNTDDFKITFSKHYFVKSGSLISKYGNYRCYLGSLNKGGLYTAIFNKYNDIPLADSSYTVLNPTNVSRVVETDQGGLLYIDTANNFTRVPLNVSANDVVSLTISYFDSDLLSGDIVRITQVYNEAVTAVLAEGSIPVENPAGKVKTLTLEFIAAFTSASLKFRFLSASNIYVLSMCAKQLGVHDGTNDARYDSWLVKPKLTKVNGYSVTSSYAGGSFTANEVKTTNVSIDGIAVGTPISVAFSQYNANIKVSAEVISTGTVAVRFENTSATVVTLPAGSVKLVLP